MDTKRKWEDAFGLVESEIGKEAPSIPVKKMFKSIRGLTELKDYDVTASASYWSNWPVLS